MDKAERERFINGLVNNVKQNLLEESAKYPDTWDGIELRWRIADVFSQVVFGDTGKRKGKRYLDYRNTVMVEGLI